MALAREPRSPTHRAIALFFLPFAWWAFCEAQWNSSATAEAALLWLRLSGPGWLFTGALYLRLVSRLFGVKIEPAGDRPLARAAFHASLYGVPAALAVLLATTRLVHVQMEPTFFGWHYVPGPAYFVFLAHCVLGLAGGFAILAMKARMAGTAQERRAARLLMIGWIVPVGVALVTDGLLPSLDVPAPRAGTFMTFVCAAFFFELAWRRQIGLTPEQVANEIVATVPDALFLVDREGRVRSANEAAVALTGLTHEELLGRRAAEMLGGEEAFRELCDALAAKGAVRDHEMVLRVATGVGEDIPVVVNAAVEHASREELERSGEPPPSFPAVLAARDVREAKRLERLQRSGEKLDALSAVIAGIAHEINNPLTGIVGFAGMLMGEDELPARAREDLRAIHAAALRCGRIVQSLLRFARQEAARRVPTDVADVARLAVAFFGSRLGPDRVRIEHDLPEPEAGAAHGPAAALPLVHADPAQLEQVFISIIANAHDAIKRSGCEGRIRVSRATADDGRSVRIDIANDGPPIPRDVVQRIFDPFFTTKSVGEGMGLGLSVSYGIVAVHDGRILVDPGSEAVDGAGRRDVVFSVVLPALAPPAETRVPDPDPARRLDRSVAGPAS